MSAAFCASMVMQTYLDWRGIISVEIGHVKQIAPRKDNEPRKLRMEKKERKKKETYCENSLHLSGTDELFSLDLPEFHAALGEKKKGSI